MNIFLKTLSTINNQTEILNFIQENRYYTVIYEIERVNLKDESETDESVSDSNESIDKERLNKIKERMRLKKKKYLLRKKNKSDEIDLKVEEVDETDKKIDVKETIESNATIEEIDLKQDENDDNFLYIKIYFKHCIFERKRSFLKYLTYDFINTNQKYKQYLKENDINFIKICKQLHRDLNGGEDSLHYNIKELRNLEEQDDIREKHVYIKNGKVDYITELIKNFSY